MKFIKSINGYVIPFATSVYKDRNEPAWSDDTGRNTMDGAFSGTKIGNFPKIIAQFPIMPDSTTQRFRQECEKEYVTLEWWSLSLGKYVTSEFYASATEADVYAVIGDVTLLQPFNVEFTGLERKK